MRLDLRMCQLCGGALIRRAIERPHEYAKRKYCSVACTGRAKVADRERRFWSRVNKGGNNECWPWGGFIGSGGYGQFATGEKTYRAHRFALLSVGVAVPDDSVVLHVCDNPPCCNPSHLRIGTARDNNRDMMAKGRAKYLTGERHHNAKLTDAQRAEIKRRSNEPLGVLAAEFGVAKSTVCRVIQKEASCTSA